MDSKEDIAGRYSNIQLPKDIEIFKLNIFGLPFADGTVDEVRADSLLEHLSFSEEKTFFLEVRRVLKPGGELVFSVPDFEVTVRQWLAAEDDWKEFFRSDAEAIAKEHWFGTYSYGTENRWGYLMASIFGPQNSEGQFHKNAYTIKKIRAILKYLDFEEKEISTFLWKEERNPMILTRAVKAA